MKVISKTKIFCYGLFWRKVFILVNFADLKGSLRSGTRLSWSKGRARGER